MAIVEDELFMREFIEKCIDYNEIGLNISGSFCCAEDALESFKVSMPDLVVTDIKMSGMDGITFISELIKINPDIHFVVISNYRDFDTVRNAFRMGIFDYISKISFEIDEYKKILSSYVRMRKEHDEKNSVSRHSKLEKQFWGESPAEDFESGGFNNREILFALVDILNYEQVAQSDWGMNKDKLKIALTGVIDEVITEADECEFFMSEYDKAVFLFYRDDYEEIKKALGVFRAKIENTFGFNVCVYFDKNRTKMRNLKERYYELYKLKKFRFFMPQDTIITQDDVKGFEDEFEYIPTTSGIESLLKDGEFEKALSELERIKNIKPSPECAGELLFFYQNMYLMICDYSKALEFDFPSEQPIKEVFEYNNYETISERLVFGVECISKNLCVSEKNLSQKIDEYIMENCSAKIELKEMAEYFKYEYSYFSKLFCKIKGMTFKKYLNNIRLEKAMNLIQNTDMTYSEISFEIGYQNYEHFSRSFYSKYGCWPSEIKSKFKRE